MIHDETGADELHNMLRSRPWSLYADRVRLTLTEKRRQLEQRGLPLPETENARGFIEALNLLISLPEILIQEIDSENGN